MNLRESWQAGRRAALEKHGVMSPLAHGGIGFLAGAVPGAAAGYLTTPEGAPDDAKWRRVLVGGAIGGGLGGIGGTGVGVVRKLREAEQVQGLINALGRGVRGGNGVSSPVGDMSLVKLIQDIKNDDAFQVIKKKNS